jgi:hypothetical protein
VFEGSIGKELLLGSLLGKSGCTEFIAEAIEESMEERLRRDEETRRNKGKTKRN